MNVFFFHLNDSFKLFINKLFDTSAYEKSPSKYKLELLFEFFCWYLIMENANYDVGVCSA